MGHEYNFKKMFLVDTHTVHLAWCAVVGAGSSLSLTYEQQLTTCTVNLKTYNLHMGGSTGCIMHQVHTSFEILESYL